MGRGPATANLGYEEVGVAMDRGFVLADEYGRTNVPGVWAVGDIVPGVQLAHRGFPHGIFVAERIAAATTLYLKCAGCHSTGGGTPMLPNLSRVKDIGRDGLRQIADPELRAVLESLAAGVAATRGLPKVS